MKIKDGFVLEKIGDAYVAVALGKAADGFHGFVKMNSTGAFLWNLLSEKDQTEDELVLSLLQKYEVSDDIARADVKKLLSRLSDAGIIE